MKPDVCGCCELPAGTPLPVINRPGLSAIVYRAGTYSSFRAAMLQRLARQSTLASLKTRDDDDYAITLIDMWSTVGDVLTFYQERIANEAFLRTGTLRDSVLRLARLIDYRLRPGVAASTRLAFTLERDAVLVIPAGLRAQSVPAGDEKPQIYETLESITADARLNRLRVLPTPEAHNPLARGGVEGILAPGADGLEIARLVSPGKRLVLFDAGALELLAVRELRIEEERATLAWTGPVQGTGWDIRSNAFVYDRTFRVFGCDAPANYVEPVLDPVSGEIDWVMRSFAGFAYTPPAANELELDAKYEDLAVGTRLLISTGATNAVATVLGVSQAQASFKPAGAETTPVNGTVTRVRLSSLPTIGDRRTALIYELKSPRLRFWGYRYPEKVAGSQVLVPARRVDATTVDLGAVIEKNAFTAGSRLTLDSIAAGREVMLRDAEPESPALAEVASVAAVGLDVSVAGTALDPTSATELLLDAEHGIPVIGLRSERLPATLSMTQLTPRLNISMGTLPARTLQLPSRPTTPSSAASMLQAAINSLLPPAPELAGCRVVDAESSLIILPRIPGTPVSISPTPDDPTSADELGLLEPGAIRVDALISGDLSPFPAVSNGHPQFSVGIGPLGPKLIQLTSAPASLISVCIVLRSAIAAADPSPAYRYALVLNLGDRMAILPGTGGASVREYLQIKLREPIAPLAIASSALLGNVARATHGESVRDEVLGDGDASLAFQKFDLQKVPLTLVSSAAPGGTESTLDVRVNGVRWSEVPSLFGRAPDDRVYTTELADDGTVTVIFGDGRSGARLPSGRRNVVAHYRKGSGLEGRVARATLRTPLDLPTGLKSVTNPIGATGGADPEALEQARENAPTTVRTFGRAVSLRDFEDLVRVSGEVAKSHATWVWNGESRAVHLTIAAQGGAGFAPEDLERIHASVNAARDPNHALFLDNHVTVPIVVEGTLSVRPDHSAKLVAGAARAALLDKLSFDTLGFGQPLAFSEIVTALQDVEGVLAVDIDRFHFKNQSAAFLAARGATVDPVQRSLRIFSARPNSLASPPVLPAEMAAIESPADDLLLSTRGGLPEATP